MDPLNQACNHHRNVGFSYDCHNCLVVTVKSLALTVDELRKKIDHLETRTTTLNRIGNKNPDWIEVAGYGGVSTHPPQVFPMEVFPLVQTSEETVQSIVRGPEYTGSYSMCTCGHGLTRHHISTLECLVCSCDVFDRKPPDPRQDAMCTCGHEFVWHTNDEQECIATDEHAQYCTCKQFEEKKD